jgi:hypothetical protein
MSGLTFFFLFIVGPFVAIALTLLSPHVWPRLFGAYYCTGWFGRMPFWTRAEAEHYREHSWDQYARGLRGPVVFVPGRLLRRTPR